MAERTKTIAPKHTTHIVRNQSERFSPILAVCVHSTESTDIPHSTSDLLVIRNEFNNPSSDASAHIGIDGQANTELWVHSEKKSWSCLNANPFTCNIEFIARAAQSISEWEDAQIKQGARWAAYWGIKYGIPAQRGVVRAINGQCVCTKKGVITHLQVTQAGFGTHTDPGPNFPMTEFLNYMRWYKQHGWLV